MLIKQPSLDSPKIDIGFLNQILYPYRATGTDYLKSTWINSNEISDAKTQNQPIISTTGLFSIPKSCYIKDTGHFNAVEFLICFNQLAYSTFGHMVNTNFFKKKTIENIKPHCRKVLAQIGIETYIEEQLSSMFILKSITRFKKKINAKQFSGHLSVNKILYRNNTIFIDTSCIFIDETDGYADGDVQLAYVLTHFH
ncbi:MAG: FcoT family thioesterase [Candidatus Thiodiazotropha sp.]|jgi:hypothetical protein